MLINITNHPSDKWPKEQMDEATKQYELVVDLTPPIIDPNITDEEVFQIAIEYRNKVIDLIHDTSAKLCAVHVMGEFTFTYTLIALLQKFGIRCVASTTERIASDGVMEDGTIKKQSIFKFVRFREYPKVM